MRRFMYMGLSFVVFILMASCTKESMNDQLIDSNFIDNTTPVILQDEYEVTEQSEEEACFTTTLIAGQNYASGVVTLAIEDGNLIITYTMSEDWTIGITHLSVGDCDDDWVPLNGGGNPKIGQFEFTEPYLSTDTEVIYSISLEELSDTICFAAHAEVQGPSGAETAWAEGTQFDGNGWAMYVQTDISECSENAENPGGAF